jgi:hypothetical protein
MDHACILGPHDSKRDLFHLQAGSHLRPSFKLPVHFYSRLVDGFQYVHKQNESTSILLRFSLQLSVQRFCCCSRSRWACDASPTLVKGCGKARSRVSPRPFFPLAASDTTNASSVAVQSSRKPRPDPNRPKIEDDSYSGHPLQPRVSIE